MCWSALTFWKLGPIRLRGCCILWRELLFGEANEFACPFSAEISGSSVMVVTDCGSPTLDWFWLTRHPNLTNYGPKPVISLLSTVDPAVALRRENWFSQKYAIGCRLRTGPCTKLLVFSWVVWQENCANAAHWSISGVGRTTTQDQSLTRLP